MKVYNKYFICLMALLLVGCKKKKTVKSTSTTTVEIESSDNNGNVESLEFSEKSATNDTEISEVIDVPASNFNDLNNKFYFGFDRDSVNSSDVKYMGELAEWLNAEENISVLIIIYGNCDQRGSASYNMGLAARRANSVKNHLVSKGVNSDRIKVVSLGQTILVEGDSEDAYAKNRVAIVELEGENSIVKKSKSVETKKTSVVAESKKSEAKAPVEADEADDDDDDDE